VSASTEGYFSFIYVPIERVHWTVLKVLRECNNNVERIVASIECCVVMATNGGIGLICSYGKLSQF
jgi:hypothetical protein